MAVVDLPDGAGKAVLRDPSSVTERARRPITRLQMRLGGSAIGDLLARKDGMTDEAWQDEMRPLMANDAEMGLLDELNDAIAAALVESVELPDGPTITVTSVDDLLDLPGKVYDGLRTVTAKHVTDLMPNFSPSPDPESPTPPSAI